MMVNILFIYNNYNNYNEYKYSEYFLMSLVIQIRVVFLF